MATALCNFAKTGNPNGDGLGQWDATTASEGKVMCWGERDSVKAMVKLIEKWFNRCL